MSMPAQKRLASPEITTARALNASHLVSGSDHSGRIMSWSTHHFVGRGFRAHMGDVVV